MHGLVWQIFTIILDVLIWQKRQPDTLSPSIATRRAYTARAYSRMSMEHYDQAQKDIEIARQLQPRQIEAMVVQAQISVWQKKYDLALQQCSDAIKVSPKYAHAYKTRADIYRRLGQADLAQAGPDQGSGAGKKSVARLFCSIIFIPACGSLQKVGSVRLKFRHR